MTKAVDLTALSGLEKLHAIFAGAAFPGESATGAVAGTARQPAWISGNDSPIELNCQDRRRI
jgi:hypothetical protein